VIRKAAGYQSARRGAGDEAASAPPAVGVAGAVAERIADALEQGILTGVHRPGERLTELTLSRELGVSQASVREALQTLEARGLVVKQPNRGTFVLEIDAVTLRHLFEVRRELESLACALLAPGLTRETLDALNNCLADMEAGAARNDYPLFLDADLRFHRLIWQAQPNRILERSLTQTCLPLFRYDRIRRYATRYENFRHSLSQHRRIVEALQTGDAELARRVTRRMVDRWFREDLSDYTGGAAGEDGE
jgi:DNA-binding GntR family transcriptional regulator